jgi:hypothetical protein
VGLLLALEDDGSNSVEDGLSTVKTLFFLLSTWSSSNFIKSEKKKRKRAKEKKG